MSEHKFCSECKTNVELVRLTKTFFQEGMIVSRAVCPRCGLLQYKREHDPTPITIKCNV